MDEQPANPSPALADPLVASLWRELLDFLEEAELAHVPDIEDLSVDINIGNAGTCSVERGVIYLFVPVYADTDNTPAERQATLTYLESAVPLPTEYSGMAVYQDQPYGQSGLMIEMLMPRRFSPRLFADAVDLVSETMERIVGLDSGATS